MNTWRGMKYALKHVQNAPLDAMMNLNEKNIDRS